MNAIITICAKNYIGLSSILGESIKASNPDVDFYIFVADEFLDDEKKEYNIPSNVYISKDVLNIPAETWDKMSFQYDLTELCTSIKPYCLEWVFNNKKCDNVLYMDPDILVFNKLDHIWNELGNHSMLITPHVTSIEEKFSGQITEEGLLFSGLYNLGFIGVHNDDNSRLMLKWWQNRLENKCFVDVNKSYFYDQRWMDFLPCFFDTKVKIDRHLGCNLAPWNFYERRVIEKDNTFYVKNRISGDSVENILLFVHYSGYNYKSLIGNLVEQKNIKLIADYDDIHSILNYYKDFLIKNKELFLTYIKLNYSYSVFSNGINIQPYHRRIYRSLVEKGHDVNNPFDANSNYFKVLSSSRLIPSENSTSIPKMKQEDVSSTYGKQLYYLNMLSRIVLKIIGVSRYMQLMKLMRYYSRFESQIHLVDKNYLKNNL